MTVTVTDYYGSPKSNVPLEIDYYDSSVLTVDWDAAGNTTGLNGQATLLAAGIAEGSSMLRVKRMASSNHGQARIDLSPPVLNVPGSIRVKKGETVTLTITVRDLFYNRPWPKLRIMGTVIRGGGLYRVDAAPGYLDGKTDQNGVCKINITGITPLQNPNLASIYRISVMPDGWAERMADVAVWVDPE